MNNEIFDDRIKNKFYKLVTNNTMKRLVFLFLLLIQTLTIGYSNNQTYCDSLFKLSEREKNNRNYAKAMEYLTTVKVYAIENKISDIQLIVLVNMGTLYCEMLDYAKAMEYYLEAYQLISKLPDADIFNNIAVLYLKSNDFDKAAEYFDKAYKTAVETNDSSTMIILLNNMALTSNKQGNLEQTEIYLELAMELLKNRPQNLFEKLIIQYVKIEYLYLKQEYDLAKQLALEALEQDIGKVNQELKVEYLLVLSKIYYQKKNYSQAISFAKDALKNSIKLPMTIEIYEHLSKVYRTTNSYLLALQCTDSVIKIKNSLTELSDMNKILSGQIQFDMKNLEKKRTEDKAKQKRNQLVWIFIIIFIISLFLLILYIRSTKLRQLKMMAELEKNEKLLLAQDLKERETLRLLEQERANNEIKEKMLLKQQLKEQEILAQLEQKTYKSEIILKNKQLVSQTLFQLSKNELMEEIIRTLSHLPNQEKIPDLQVVIHKLKTQLRDPVNTDWNSFLTYFEQTNPDFLAALKKKHPNLSANDVRLSSYISLNLGTKEISKLLHITPEHCKKKKQRLAEKLDMPTSQIYNYLSNIV